MTTALEQSPTPKTVDVPFAKHASRFSNIASLTRSHHHRYSLQGFRITEAIILSDLRNQYIHCLQHPDNGPFENPTLTPRGTVLGRVPDQVRFGNSTLSTELSGGQLLELLDAVYEVRPTELNKQAFDDNFASVQQILDALRSCNTVVLRFDL